MLHHGKHAPVPTILRPVQIWNELILFKHLLCYLCSTKILAYVIWNSFSFNFIQIKKNVPTFPEFVLYKKNEKIHSHHKLHFLSHTANTITCPLHTQSGSADSTQLRLLKLRPVACSSSWTLLTTPPAVVTGHSDSSAVTLVLTVWVTVGSPSVLEACRQLSLLISEAQVLGYTPAHGLQVLLRDPLTDSVLLVPSPVCN